MWLKTITASCFLLNKMLPVWPKYRRKNAQYNGQEFIIVKLERTLWALTWYYSQLLQRNIGITVIWEMFFVKIFSWARGTMKIKRTNICLQQRFCRLNFCGLAQPAKRFLCVNFLSKKLTQRFHKLRYQKVGHNSLIMHIS